MVAGSPSRVQGTTTTPTSKIRSGNLLYTTNKNLTNVHELDAEARRERLLLDEALAEFDEHEDVTSNFGIHPSPRPTIYDIRHQHPQAARNESEHHGDADARPREGFEL